jgi:hypothetical protein
MLHKEVTVILVITAGEMKHWPVVVPRQTLYGTANFRRVQAAQTGADAHEFAALRENITLVANDVGSTQYMTGGAAPARDGWRQRLCMKLVLVIQLHRD